jgi:hypothetical protein
VADDWTEDEYVECLQSERPRFAWVMEQYGDFTPAEAAAAENR